MVAFSSVVLDSAESLHTASSKPPEGLPHLHQPATPSSFPVLVPPPLSHGRPSEPPELFTFPSPTVTRAPRLPSVIAPSQPRFHSLPLVLAHTVSLLAPGKDSPVSCLPSSAACIVPTRIRVHGNTLRP